MSCRRNRAPPRSSLAWRWLVLERPWHPQRSQRRNVRCCFFNLDHEPCLLLFFVWIDWNQAVCQEIMMMLMIVDAGDDGCWWWKTRQSWLVFELWTVCLSILDGHCRMFLHCCNNKRKCADMKCVQHISCGKTWYICFFFDLLGSGQETNSWNNDRCAHVLKNVGTWSN